MRVLVVEDNLPIRKAVAKGLREAGFAVDVSGDGEEGLWFATSNDYDVVVLDLMLPGVDGLTILKRLRAEGRSTHVLILTARDTVLVSTARAISVSVERTDSGLRTDIDETEMPEFRRADRPEYFEVWRQDGPVLARSSSLRQADLERFEGVPGAFVFRSIRLPDGRPGRAAGLRFTPMADDEADYPEAMAECLAIVRRTDALVTSLLTLARLEGGPGPLHRESIALGEAVRDALQPLQGRIAARRLAVESHVPEDLRVAADRATLGMVLTALLENATAYAMEGGRIEIAAERADGPVTLAVANTGCHLSDDDVGHVFERFWRADTSRTDTGTHCGLGLAIVRRAVESLGGTATASASGDVFTIRIALPPPPTEQP